MNSQGFRRARAAGAFCDFRSASAAKKANSPLSASFEPVMLVTMGNLTIRHNLTKP
jgi:hypothetical protein